MEHKGMFIGALGQKLDEKLKRVLSCGIINAIEQDLVSHFYFINDQEYSENESLMIKESLSENQRIYEYIAEEIKRYAEQKEKTVTTAIIVARPIDTNYHTASFDEVIQGYFIYGVFLDSEDSSDAYDLRNEYLVKNIDIFYWYSDPILDNTSDMLACAKKKNKTIRYI